MLTSLIKVINYNIFSNINSKTIINIKDINGAMNEKTKFVVIGIVAMLAVAGGGYVVFSMMGGGDGEVKITDSLGREVMIPKKVDKVVCQEAGTLRLVSYFGQSAMDKVVGIDKGDAKVIMSPANYDKATYRLAYPDLINKTNVGSFDNAEAVKNTGANVIITSKTSASDVNNFQTATGIPIVAINIMNEINDGEIAKFNEVVRIVGKTLGMESRAEKLIKDIGSLVSELKTGAAKVTETQRKTAYVGGLFYMNAGGIYNTTGNYSAFDLTGVKNVMPVKSGLPYNTDKEGVKAANPDFIFFDLMNGSAYKTAFAADKTFFSSVNAVSQNNIYSVAFFKYYGTNWENQLINAFYVGSIVYPDYFTFTDEKADQILKVFYGDKLKFSTLKTKQSPGTVKLSDW